MVVLLAVTAVVVSASVILTTQVLGASNRGDPVAVPPQSSIQEAPPGTPSTTRSRPSVFCHRDERPVDCVRWMQPLDHRVPPVIMATPLGPLLHGGGTLALHDRDTGQVLWVRRSGERDGHIVGILPADGSPKIILDLGHRLAFVDLRTGTLHDRQRTTEMDGYFDSVLIADDAVHTTTVRNAPDGRPMSVVVAARTPEGPRWEVEMPMDLDWDHLPTAQILSVTSTEVVVHTRDALVVLDAMTGEERQRRAVQPGWTVADGGVLLRTVWDDLSRESSSLRAEVTLHAEVLSSGEALWAQEIRPGAHWWPLTVGRVVVFDRPDMVVLDTQTGEVQWTLPLASAAELVWGIPPETGVLVLADLATDRLRGIESATGEELWRAPSPWTLPSDLPWTAMDEDHLVLRRPQRDGLIVLDRTSGHIVVDLRTDGRLAADPWTLDVPWPILQSSTGHLYLVSLDLPEAGR